MGIKPTSEAGEARNKNLNVLKQTVHGGLGLVLNWKMNRKMKDQRVDPCSHCGYHAVRKQVTTSIECHHSDIRTVRVIGGG
jgi:hypothetical protein